MKNGFTFKYNEYEKPSSKSYLAPKVKEINIKRYDEEIENKKHKFKVYINGESKLSEAAIDQLIIYFMNIHNINRYSDIIIEVYSYGYEKTTDC